MEPYRSSSSACPQCSSPLREFNKRLVCDKCEGMMLAIDDYAGSMRDIDLTAFTIELFDREADKVKCPRCSETMQSCRVKYGELKLKERYLACERDGLWASADNMLAAYARVSRTAAPGTSTLGHVVNATVGTAATGSGTGALRGISNAFGARLVSHRSDKSKPRVHSEFVSELRGHDMRCPACGDKPLAFEGDRWACEACKGAFVENAALVTMVSDIRQDIWEMPAVTGAAGKRTCPACKQPMIEEKLGTPTIDRCATHGTWFDDTELAAALLDASGETPGVGIRGWLKKLFS